MELQIGGFEPLSTVDYPEQLAAVVFCQGCAWRCRYCHNPQLTMMENPNTIQWYEVMDTLIKRKNLLDAVVFSGGEPTLQCEALIKAIQETKDMDYEIGLHTAGIFPDRFAAVLPLVDWVGFDIKTVKDDYTLITGSRNGGCNAYQSLQMLLSSGVDYEVRITLDPDLIPLQTFERLLNKMEEMGVKKGYIQPVRSKDGTANIAEYKPLLNYHWKVRE